jgi:biotin operon repressor
MTNETLIRALVRAVAAGKVFGQASAEALGMSSATFWRRVARAEELGVRFTKNERGGRRYGTRAITAKPWRVRAWGQFKGDTKCPRSKPLPKKSRTS